MVEFTITLLLRCEMCEKIYIPVDSRVRRELKKMMPGKNCRDFSLTITRIEKSYVLMCGSTPFRT